MSDPSENNVYIPPCGNKACKERLNKIAEIVTKCTTTHPISGKFSVIFDKHFNKHRYTVIHFCPDLWQKVQCREKELERSDDKVILLNLNFNDVKQVISESTNKADLESVTKFFKTFGSQHVVSDDQELLLFAENVKKCVKTYLEEDENETISEEDEGYPTSNTSGGAQPHSTGSADPYSEHNRTNYPDGVAADSANFKEYPDIFGQTKHQNVFVQNCHICDSSPNVHIYIPDKSSATGSNIESLNKGLSPDKIMSNNKYILLKTLPDIYHRKDLPALASVCMCKDIILQKRALILLELCIWEEMTGDPEKYLSCLVNVESILDIVLKNLQQNYLNTKEVVYRAIFARAFNVYIMVLSAIVMCSKYTQVISDKCYIVLRNIRTRSKDKTAEPVSKLNQFVTASKDFLRVKAETVSIIDMISRKDKNASKSARQLYSKGLMDQGVVTFEVLKKVFELNADVLSFLLDYLSPRKGFRKKEPESVCIVMVFRALTLFLKYLLLNFTHMNVQELCQEIINVLFVASKRDLPHEVERSLHSLLFHPNPVVRTGIFKILEERKKYKFTHIQYLQNEIVGILKPLLNLHVGSQRNLITFKCSSWMTLSGKFGRESVLLFFLVMTEKDFCGDIKVALENHKDINYNEMYHLMRIQHRNIIQLFAFQRIQVPLFYIIEDCSQTLQAVMQNYRNNGKYFTHLELCRFLLDAVRALKYCHDKNLIHRNLTAESLTYSDNKVVKLCHFGMCVELGQSQKVLDFDNHKNIPFRWSARESILDCEYSKNSDIWMVGVLIYEVMTHGVLPFSKLTVSDRILGDKMRKKSVRLNTERCLDDTMFQMIDDCTTVDPESRPFIVNVKTRIEEVIQVFSKTPRTVEQFPYPKFDKEERQPSTVFIRGLPSLLRPWSMNATMGGIVNKKCEKLYISDILVMMQEEHGNIFCEEVISNMPREMLSLLHSEELKGILTQTIKLFQDHDLVQYIVTSIPPSKSIMSLIMDGHMTNLKTVFEIILQVAIKLSKIASLDLVLGDLYPSAVYIDCNDHRNVYIVSLVFMKGPVEDKYHVYNQNQPIIPEFIIPRAAPELFHENNFSPKSDVYCFGGFMWQTLMAFDVNKNSVYVNAVADLFHNMSFQEIQSAVLNNEWDTYNPCPVCCPYKVYQLIKSCVSNLKTERPTMEHVVIKLKEYYAELFDTTIEEFVPGNSPRENVLETCYGSSTVESLSEVNPSTSSSFASMLSNMFSLQEINPSVASTTSDFENDFVNDGFELSRKYYDIDYHAITTMEPDNEGATCNSPNVHYFPQLEDIEDEDIYSDISDFGITGDDVQTSQAHALQHSPASDLQQLPVRPAKKSIKYSSNYNTM